MAVIPVPAGHLAVVVTDLEMRARPLPRPLPPSPLRLVRWHRPALDAYRTLFRRVGAHWLWYSRLVLNDAALGEIVHAKPVEIFAVVDARGIEVGMLELDFRKQPDAEIVYFALVPELTGKGHGHWLMAQALALAWRSGVECVWLHTCTLDHPGALRFYVREGFKAVARDVQTFPDPRLTGHLPRDVAPQVPLLDPSSSR
jgi:GNAT superfamily N-acetyltransferase